MSGILDDVVRMFYVINHLLDSVIIKMYSSFCTSGKEEAINISNVRTLLKLIGVNSKTNTNSFLSYDYNSK